MDKRCIRLIIDLGKPYQIGTCFEGMFQIIPILGGQVFGFLQGKILPFGADYNIRYDDVTSKVEACYIIETQDHEKIVVYNKGFIDKREENQTTTPLFFTDQKNAYAFLMKNRYVGHILHGTKEKIEIEILEVCNDTD